MNSDYFSTFIIFFILIILFADPASAITSNHLSTNNNASPVAFDSTNKKELFSIQYQLDDDLIVNESSTLIVTLQAKKSITGTSISIIQPFGFNTTPQSISVGTLSQNESISFELSIKSRYPLTRNLRLQITGTQNGDSFERSFAYELESKSGEISAKSSTTPNRGNQTGIGTRLIGGASNSNGTISASNNDCNNVKITGKGEYSYNGITYPMDNVLIEVWDYDTNSENDFVASQWATQDGAFSFCVVDTDSDEAGSFDPFVSIVAKNPAAITRTEGGSVHYASTNSYDDVSNGETLTLGTDSDGDGQLELIPANDNPAWQAVDWSLDEYQFIRDNTDDNWNRSQLTIYWPSGTGGAYYPEYTIFGELDESADYVQLPDKQRYSDWGSTTVYHEYGHAMMLC